MTAKNNNKDASHKPFAFDYQNDLKAIWQRNLLTTDTKVLCVTCSKDPGVVQK